MSPVTTIVVTDPELLAKLATAEGPIVFRGPNGEYVRVAEPVSRDRLPAVLRPPISDEEFEKLRKSPDGIPLAEFWKKVERGEWK